MFEYHKKFVDQNTNRFRRFLIRYHDNGILLYYNMETLAPVHTLGRIFLSTVFFIYRHYIVLDNLIICTCNAETILFNF